MDCCSYCNVLAKELDAHKGNVFYDVRKSWIFKGEGFLPDQRKVMVERGRKLLGGDWIDELLWQRQAPKKAPPVEYA